MTKASLIARLRKERGWLGTQAGETIDVVFEALRAELEAGNTVRIPGFGTFRRKFRDTREVRNPRTGELTVKQAHHVITFKEGKPRR